MIAFLKWRDGEIECWSGFARISSWESESTSTSTVFVLDVCRVRIGDYTLFGPGVQILTPINPLEAGLRRKQEYGKPINIRSDVWVDGGALILPGVCIGSKTVIGAGSVVTRDVPAGGSAAGNPCRVIREITENG